MSKATALISMEATMKINNFIAVAAMAEKEGILDFKNAYFNLRHLIKTNLIIVEDGPEETDL